MKSVSFRLTYSVLIHMVDRAPFWINSSSWVTVKLLGTGLWAWEAIWAFFSLQPTGIGNCRTPHLRIFPPFWLIYSLLIVRTWRVCIASFGFAIPVPLWYQVVFRKSPAAGTQPVCVFLDKELAFYLSSYAIYIGVFWSSDFVIWSCKPPLQASSCLSLTAYVIHFSYIVVEVTLNF